MQLFSKTTQIEFFPILVLGYNVKIFLRKFNNYSRAPSKAPKMSPNFLFLCVLKHSETIIPSHYLGQYSEIESKKSIQTKTAYNAVAHLRVGHWAITPLGQNKFS